MTKKTEKKYESPKVGQKIYVPSELHISRGSDDVAGGIATITKVSKGMSGGKMFDFIEVKEVPGTSYNWEQFLSKEQEKLKKQYGKQKAHPDPDIDTPWIEEGDFVNGKKYHGPDIW
jgi:hypothetical protein